MPAGGLHQQGKPDCPRTAGAGWGRRLGLEVSLSRRRREHCRTTAFQARGMGRRSALGPSGSQMQERLRGLGLPRVADGPACAPRGSAPGPVAGAPRSPSDGCPRRSSGTICRIRDPTWRACRGTQTRRARRDDDREPATVRVLLEPCRVRREPHALVHLVELGLAGAVRLGRPGLPGLFFPRLDRYREGLHLLLPPAC